MNLYQDEPKPDNKDTYYIEQSQKAIAAAMAAGEGKSPEEIRSLIRRNYPFGPLRRGRAYKIFNKLVLQAEVDLGLEPRRHRLHGNSL